MEIDWTADDVPLPNTLGCSSDESGLVYGIEWTGEDVAAGEYQLSAYFKDDCGDQSNQIDVAWTITE